MGRRSPFPLTLRDWHGIMGYRAIGYRHCSFHIFLEMSCFATFWAFLVRRLRLYLCNVHAIGLEVRRLYAAIKRIVVLHTETCNFNTSVELLKYNEMKQELVIEMRNPNVT